MRFLDPKEEVFKIKLTSYGRHLLSAGKFDPEYYAFFDDDIIYDLSYLSGTGNTGEPQNNIQERILDKTPRFEGQTSFEDCETTVFSPNAGNIEHIFPGVGAKKNDPSYNITVAEKPTKNYFLQNPLGRSAYGTDKPPFFSLQMITGAIDSVTIKGSGSAGSGYYDNKEDVPASFTKQVEVNLTNEITINAGNSQITPTKELDNDELFDAFYVFSDGSSMSYEKRKAFFALEEGNTHFLKENFDIEVYEVIEQEVTKTLPGGEKVTEKVEDLIPMSFAKDDEVPSPLNVEYYFNIFVDNEIDRNYYCDALKTKTKNKTKDIFSDNTFKCPDEESEKVNLNIYNTDQLQEPADKC